MTAIDSGRTTGEVDPRQIDEVVADCRGKPGGVLMALEALQKLNRHNYLPKRTLELVARKMGVAPAQIQSVATFYAFFNLEPQGDHSVCVCRGTACHTRGSRVLLSDLTSLLGLPPTGSGQADKACQTTDDMKFTVRTVACFGQCAMAPVVEIDHEIEGQVNRQSLRTAVEALRTKGERS